MSRVQALADAIYAEKYEARVRAAWERNHGAGAAAWAILRRRAWWEAYDALLVEKWTDGSGLEAVEPPHEEE